MEKPLLRGKDRMIEFDYPPLTHPAHGEKVLYSETLFRLDRTCINAISQRDKLTGKTTYNRTTMFKYR